MSEQLALPFGVRKLDFDKKSNLMLHQTRLIAENLHVTVFVDNEWAKTEGKAYLINQETLSSEETRSSVLQETTNGQLIVMETTHPSNEDVAKQFERKKRNTEDHRLMMYPLYGLMFILVILYSVLIYKTGVKKEPIIIESSQWFDIFLVTLIFALVEGFIYYWMYTQYIDKTIFKARSMPSSKTYEVRHDGHVESISATTFRGFFFTLTTASAKKIWGHTVSEYEEYFVDDNNVPLNKIQDRLISMKHQCEKKIVDAFKLKEMKQTELDKLEMKLAQEIRSKSEEVLESEVKSQIDSDPDYIKKKEELQGIKKNYDEIYKEYYEKWQQLKEDIATNQETYNKRLEALLDHEKEEIVKGMVIQDRKYIMKLEHDKTILTSKIIALQNMLTSAYEEGLLRSDQVMEHVYSILHEEGSKKYEINYTLQNQNGQPVQNGNSNGYHNPYQQESGGTHFDITPIVKILITAISVIAVIYGIGWLIPKILSAFGGLGPLAILGMFLFLVFLIYVTWFILKSVNMVADSAGNRTTLKMR